MLNIKGGTLIPICHFDLTYEGTASSIRQIYQVLPLQQDSLMLSEEMSEEGSPH